ncbi:isochorismate synthase [Hoyosella rhizosphaerae]|uniref:isochorismate synthase n=1 Tax=Hoyosella rhizosphaerae TaxID=1755582 RepID=UPI001E4739BE|nr:isochorismate synthase [Hoyosella rhizosphaerae]
MEPLPFVLSRPHRTVVARGASTEWADVEQAQRALRNGSTSIVVGAIPFDIAAPCALRAPLSATFTVGPIRPNEADAVLPTVTTVVADPSGDEHVRRVRRLVERIKSGELDKVVAARSLLVTCEDTISPMALLHQLVALDHVGNGFSVDLAPAGPHWEGRALVGASPEVLIRREGNEVSCWPLAGTAPRSHDPAIDAERADTLLQSSKNLHEHAFVVDWLREQLSPLCESLIVAPQPTLFPTPAVWHLGTPIRGTLRAPSISALDVALAVHPTPAVGGTPHQEALRAIREIEGDRGFYAGAVGWCNAEGDGEWMVAIRCAEVYRNTARAFAGGGIVDGSDPDEELAETSVKLRTLLAAMGVSDATVR